MPSVVRLVDGGSDWLEFETSGTIAAYPNASTTEITFGASEDGTLAVDVGSEIVFADDFSTSVSGAVTLTRSMSGSTTLTRSLTGSTTLTRTLSGSVTLEG